MAEINGDDLPRLEPAFDPIAFQADHDDLKMANYELNKEKLEEAVMEQLKFRHDVNARVFKQQVEEEKEQ